MLHKKTVLLKKRHFHIKKLLFYKLNGCKKYCLFTKNNFFVKKQLFYVKKAAFLQVNWL